MNPIPLKNDFHPPKLIKREFYLLEALSAKHNERDYEAWMSSRESLRGIFGPQNEWPFDVSSLEKNLSDLENHWREFVEREAFTYSILSLDKERCIGCIYIRPSKHKDYQARVDYWFRDSEKSFDSEFLQWANRWLKEEWGIDSPCFPGRTIGWDEYLNPSK